MWGIFQSYLFLLDLIILVVEFHVQIQHLHFLTLKVCMMGQTGYKFNELICQDYIVCN